jgi:DNA polymerase-3 subunit epsilon
MLNNSVIVSHNKSFDLGFLQSEFNRVGIELSGLDGICTLRLSKILFPELPSRKLEVLCEYLDVLVENAHRAYDDCTATAQLFHKMYQTYLEHSSTADFEQEFIYSNWFSHEINLVGRLIEYKREDAKEKIKYEESKMKVFLQRIPDFYKPADYNISEYLNLLDRILEDRLITDEEFEEIEEYANANRISSKKLNDIHEEYYRRLVRYYLSDKILSETELLDLEKVASLLQIDKEASSTILDLEKAELELGKYVSSAGAHKFVGSTVCFTGQLCSKLNGRLIDRELAHSLAIENGLIVKQGVSKKLDLLVVADPNSQSSKARKARAYGTKIMAEAVFWKNIGLYVE